MSSWTGATADIALCWAGSKGCIVRWDVVDAVGSFAGALFALIGVTAVLIPFLIERKRQREREDRRRLQLARRLVLPIDQAIKDATERHERIRETLAAAQGYRQPHRAAYILTLKLSSMHELSVLANHIVTGADEGFDSSLVAISLVDAFNEKIEREAAVPGHGKIEEKTELDILLAISHALVVLKEAADDLAAMTAGKLRQRVARNVRAS